MDNEYYLVVRWYPPYSNNYKEQPVNHLRSAQTMVDWFRSINVNAEIIRVESIKTKVVAGESDE